MRQTLPLRNEPRGRRWKHSREIKVTQMSRVRKMRAPAEAQVQEQVQKALVRVQVVLVQV